MRTSEFADLIEASNAGRMEDKVRVHIGEGEPVVLTIAQFVALLRATPDMEVGTDARVIDGLIGRSSPSA